MARGTRDLTTAMAVMASFLSVLCVPQPLAQADTVVIPIGAEFLAGTAGASTAVGNPSSAAYQVVYSAAQMAGVPAGSIITGMQLRLRNSATAPWPTNAITITNYDVRFADSPQTPATMSTTFASNMTDAVLVRSGSMPLAAGAYPGGPNSGVQPEAWGPEISFTTPYVYGGGAMAVEFRTDNTTVSGAVQGDVFSIAGGGAASVTATPSSAAAGTSVAANAGLAIRLTYTPPDAAFQTGITRLMILQDLANQDDGVSYIPLADSPIAQQTIAAESEMRLLGRGSRLVGMFHRSLAIIPWPTAADFYPRYDIELSRAVNTPSAMSSTIANNIGSDVQLVRSGRLDLPAGVMLPRIIPQVAPWTWEIRFATPYIYKGGGLMTLVRHEPSNSGNFTAVSALQPSDPAFGTRVRSRNSGGTTADATVAGQDNHSPVQLFSVDSGVVVPNVNVDTPGTAASGGLFTKDAYTSQTILHASQLSHIPVGSQITGLTFRGKAGISAPTQNLAFSNYRVWMSTAATTPLTISPTFADNDGPDVMEVRSGPFSLLKNSLSGNSAATSYGPTLHFQRAFIYQGGGLCITVRHPGNGVEDVNADAFTGFSLSRSSTAPGENAAAITVLRFTGAVTRVEFNPSVTVPSALRNRTGDNSYLLFSSSAGSVMQSVYAADQLRSLRIGSLITGMSLRRFSRNDGGDPWPAVDTELPQFDVTLSSSPVPPEAMSDTFANNIGSDAILVKSGPTTIPAGSFPYVESQTQPNENKWFLQFTEPFLYKGGPLSVTIRNPSSHIVWMDAWDTDPTVAAGRWSSQLGTNATVHNQGNAKGALILRFAFVPAGSCPADLDNDGLVDDADFVLFAQDYNTLDCADPAMPMGCPADLNLDRFVDDSDFSLFAGAYNELLCP